MKGTAASVPQFFLTRNEHGNGMMVNPAWRLAIVTDALSDDPKVRIYLADQVQKMFDLAPYVFLGTLIPIPES